MSKAFQLAQLPPFADYFGSYLSPGALNRVVLSRDAVVDNITASFVLTRVGTSPNNVIQSIAVDQRQGKLFTQHISTTFSPPDDASVINRYNLINASTAQTAEDSSAASILLGHQGLAVQYTSDTATKLWTSAPYASGSGAKAIRFDYVPSGSGALTGLETYTLFPADAAQTSSTPTISFDQKLLIVKRQRTVASVDGYDVRVFRLSDIGAGGDYSTATHREFWVAKVTGGTDWQGVACDGQLLYVLEGTTTIGGSNYLTTYTLDGTLVERVLTPVGKVDSAATGAGTYHEPEGLCFAVMNGALVLLMLVSSGDVGARACRIYALGGLVPVRDVSDSLPALNSLEPISGNGSLLFKGNMITTGETLATAMEPGLRRVASGADAVTVGAPNTASGGVLEILSPSGVQAARNTLADRIQRYTARAATALGYTRAPRSFLRSYDTGTTSFSDWFESVFLNATRGEGIEKVLVSDAVAVALTGSASLTSAKSYTIPGGSLGANGYLKVEVLVSCTNSANTKTLTVKYGTQTIISNTAALTSQASLRVETKVQNVNNVAVQKARANSMTNSFGQTTATPLFAGTVATGSDQTLQVDLALSNTGETITVESVIVSYCYKA